MTLWKTQTQMSPSPAWVTLALQHWPPSLWSTWRGYICSTTPCLKITRSAIQLSIQHYCARSDRSWRLTPPFVELDPPLPAGEWSICSTADHKALQRVLKTLERLIGCHFPSEYGGHRVKRGRSSKTHASQGNGLPSANHCRHSCFPPRPSGFLNQPQELYWSSTTCSGHFSFNVHYLYAIYIFMVNLHLIFIIWSFMFFIIYFIFIVLSFVLSILL